MSRALFDLGARLRAAHTGRPVPVAAYGPALPPTNALAVTVDHDGEHVYVNATDGTTTLAGTDRDGLTALADLGATLGPTHLRERLFGPTTFGNIEGDPSDCNNPHIRVTQRKLDRLEIVTPFGGIRPLFFYQWGLHLNDPLIVLTELTGFLLREDVL